MGPCSPGLRRARVFDGCAGRRARPRCGARRRPPAPLRPRRSGGRLRVGAGPPGPRPRPARHRRRSPRATGCRTRSTPRGWTSSPTRARSFARSSTRSTCAPSIWWAARRGACGPPSSRSTHPTAVSSLVLVGAPPGITHRVPIQLRLFGLPLIGQPLGRLLMSRPTRDGNRKLWGKVLVAIVHVVRIPGAGHLPWIDDPGRVVGEIERFLATRRRTGEEFPT